jgi:hypothetical protein
MAAQSPITFVGTFPNITGLTQLKTGDTLAGVVNHTDFSPNSVMFADSVGVVAAAVLPENTVLGNTGSGITSLTMATLAPLVAAQLDIDDFFTVSGLNEGDTVVYSGGSWANLPNTLGTLTDVTAGTPSAGSFLVYGTTAWEAQAGPPVDGQIYGYQNGAWVRVPISDGSGGTLDHSALANLLQDTHTQYHNDARGDARYYTQTALDGYLSNKAPLVHQHVLADITDRGALAAKDTVSASDIDARSVGLNALDPVLSTEGQIIRSTGTGTDPVWATIPTGLALSVQGLTPGVKNYVVATTNWRITGWYLVSTDPGTTAVVDVLKSSNAIPSSLQTITGTEKPSLVNGQLASDTALTSWTDLDVAPGDVFGIEVESTNGASSLLTLSLIGYQL